MYKLAGASKLTPNYATNPLNKLIFTCIIKYWKNTFINLYTQLKRLNVKNIYFQTAPFLAVVSAFTLN